MNNTKNNLKDIFFPINENLSDFERKLIESINVKSPLTRKLCEYAVASGGKRIRPALVFLFAGMFDEIHTEHAYLACAVELIHNATLIHDDIIDDAEKRHNLPSIYKKWDTKSAVLAGDFLIAKALDFLIQTHNEKVLALFSEITKKICSTEIEQLCNKSEITFDEYIERVKRKTGLLFNLCTQGACLISNNKNNPNAENFALNLGIAFQIIDDILPFKENYDEKSIQVDFINNVQTLPIILARGEGVFPSIKDGFNVFRQSILSTKVIDKCYALALKYLHNAIQSLECFENNQYKRSLINLAEYIVDREF